MSQNPDETRGPKDSESELDYGAFAADEPDFPEDRLDKERAPEDASEQSGAPVGGQSAATPATAPAADSAPAADEPQAASAADPAGYEEERTRSLSEELAAARSDSSADRLEAAQTASADAPAAADEQSTTVIPPSTQSETTPQRESISGSAEPGPGHQQPPAAVTPAPPPAQYAGAQHSGSRYTGSNDEITTADIDEEVTKSKRGVSRFLTVLIAIFTPVLFVVAAVRLVGTPVFLWFTYRRPGFPEDPQGFGLEERMLYGSYGMDFLFNLANFRYLADLTGPDGEPLFTSDGSDMNEVSHMVDVKEVVWIAMLVGMGLLLLTLVFALMLRSWRPGSFARGVFAGAWATVAVLIALAVLAILDWRMFFAEFHNLFFDGNWAFPDDFTLIRLYPNQFWVDAGIWIAALLVIFTLVALLITWPTKRRRARRAERLGEVQDRRRQKLIKELNSSSAHH